VALRRRMVAGLVALLAVVFVVWVVAERRSTEGHLSGIVNDVLVHPLSICDRCATPELLRAAGGTGPCRRVARRMQSPFGIVPGDIHDGYAPLDVHLGGWLFADSTALVVVGGPTPGSGERDAVVRLARRGGQWRIRQLRWVQSVRRDGRLVLGILGRPQRGDVAFSAGD
jgi:hypothetical protein